MQLIEQMPITSTHPDHNDILREALQVELLREFIEIALDIHAPEGKEWSSIEGVWDDCHYLMKRVELQAINIIEFLLARGVDAACNHEEFQEYLTVSYVDFDEDMCSLLDSIFDDIVSELCKHGFRFDKPV